MNKTTLLFLVLPFGFLSDAFAGTWHGNKMPDWSAQKSVDKSSACNLAIWDQRSTLRFSLPVAIAPNGSVDARSSQFWDVKRTDKRISISSNRFSNWAKQDHVPMVIELDDQKRATEVSWPDFKPGANPLNPPLVYHMSYDDQGRCAIDRVQAMDNSGQKHYWVDAGLCRDLKDAKGLKERRINESSRSSEPPIDPVIESIIDKHRENIEFPALTRRTIDMRLLKARTDAFVDKMIQNPVYNAAAYLERCEATGVIAGLTLPQVTRVAEEQPADGAAVVKELEHPKN